MVSVSDVDSPTHESTEAIRYMESMKPDEAKNFAQMSN